MVAKAVTSAVRETFTAMGYAHVPEVYPRDMVAELRTELDRLVAGMRDSAWSGAWRESYPAPGYTLYTLHGLDAVSDPWKDAIAHQPARALASELLGTTATCTKSTLVSKPPKTGQPFPLHQDAVYMKPKHPYVLMTLYLDDVTPDNGSICVVPQSHVNGTQRHVGQASGKQYLDSVTLADAVCPQASAGDVLCFSPFTVHGSHPNTSEKMRHAVRLVWA